MSGVAWDTGLMGGLTFFASKWGGPEKWGEFVKLSFEPAAPAPFWFFEDYEAGTKGLAIVDDFGCLVSVAEGRL